MRNKIAETDHETIWLHDDGKVQGLIHARDFLHIKGEIHGRTFFIKKSVKQHRLNQDQGWYISRALLELGLFNKVAIEVLDDGTQSHEYASANTFWEKGRWIHMPGQEPQIGLASRHFVKTLADQPRML